MSLATIQLRTSKLRCTNHLLLSMACSQKKRIGALIQDKKDRGIFDGIFQIIKRRTLELEVFEVWHDVIYYKGTELIWKSFFNAKDKKMGVEVLYSRENHSFNTNVH